MYLLIPFNKAYITIILSYKSSQDRLWRFYRRLEADALLLRSAGALEQLQASEVELLGDFSLNASNAARLCSSPQPSKAYRISYAIG